MKKKTIQKKRRAKARFTRFLTVLAMVCCAVCIILIVNKTQIHEVKAGNSVQLNKYYKTITIQSGDTLWSIAQEYNMDDSKSTKDYVEELMSMNNLHNDNITAGQKLLVTYFE